MSLVKDDRRVIGYHPAKLIAANAEIGKEEMVVDDNDIRILGICPHSRDKARFEIGAFLADTGLTFCIDAAPKGKVLGQVDEFAAVAGTCFAAPGGNAVKMSKLVKPVEYRLAVRLMNAVKTGVI